MAGNRVVRRPNTNRGPVAKPTTPDPVAPTIMNLSPTAEEMAVAQAKEEADALAAAGVHDGPNVSSGQDTVTGAPAIAGAEGTTLTDLTGTGDFSPVEPAPVVMTTDPEHPQAPVGKIVRRGDVMLEEWFDVDSTNANVLYFREDVHKCVLPDGMYTPSYVLVARAGAMISRTAASNPIR